MVKFMIETKPELINVRNYEGKTPLLCTYSLQDFGTFLPKICKKKNCHSIVSLDFFVVRKIAPENLMRYLISKGADVNAKQNNGQRALLHLIARNGDNETIAKLLIENNADVDIRDEFGTTPLYFAAQNGKIIVW